MSIRSAVVRPIPALRPLIAAAAIALPIWISPASAQMPVMPMSDQVILDITVEDWVTTETARVVAVVDAAVTGDAGTTRSDMSAAVRALAPDTDWRLVRFDRSQDSSGLERWRASFEARLAEEALSGIADRARAASKPGMQLSVETIDFSPTLAEIEEKRTGLRHEVYRRVGSELNAVRTAFPERNFRVGTVEFMTEPHLIPMARAQMMEMAVKAADAPAADAMTVSQKITLSARVILSAVPPDAGNGAGNGDGNER